ncbi:MAG TPA: ribbon-helix-helix protein, CopG family [Chthoniobacterales bacterium]|nr:ribbon-helix-helix protein, CopG family [Chthoniobacterales bacterium]
MIDLPEEQVRKLAVLCRKEKISRAEAVRRAVGQLLLRSTGGDLKSFFGASTTRGSVARQVKKLRSEWKARA